jgi:hypothetical protein
MTGRGKNNLLPVIFLNKNSEKKIVKTDRLHYTII